MASSSFAPASGKRDFDVRVNLIKARKSDINALILDYLTMEGYPQAAAKFSREANLKPLQDDSFIRTRQIIQNSIHMGNIEDAMSALNYHDPDILNENPALHFALLRLQLVELIREGNNGGDIQPALKFATDRLGPRAPMNQEFLQDLEQTMSLLFFVPEKLPPELKKLLSPELRREVADMVNKAILFKNSRRREAAIRSLVRMRAWAENAARDAKKDLPPAIELGLQALDGESLDILNGHEPMVTT